MRVTHFEQHSNRAFLLKNNNYSSFLIFRMRKTVFCQAFEHTENVDISIQIRFQNIKVGNCVIVLHYIDIKNQQTNNVIV